MVAGKDQSSDASKKKKKKSLTSNLRMIRNVC